MEWKKPHSCDLSTNAKTIIFRLQEQETGLAIVAMIKFLFSSKRLLCQYVTDKMFPETTDGSREKWNKISTVNSGNRQFKLPQLLIL